ncbi:AAA family ATPase [Nonomuraea sp. NPDC049400]|uniref:AAA family ATPase n=1 Tax=Nonomuraea sp. NPDC049400 TaxID=3364352 RepID=UPI0037949491
MIIWLNGPHGIGKTTTAAALARRIPGSCVFDPETVGFILRRTLEGVRPVSDFRHWPPWRRMVATAAVSISEYVESTLILPQTVAEREYWAEIRTAIETAGIPLKHFTLIADHEEHLLRIDRDEVEIGARGGRRSKADGFRSNLGWLANESIILDTTGRSVDDVVTEIIRSIGLPAADSMNLSK